MSKRIYKYALLEGEGELTVPWGSKFLSVDLQYGQPRVWVLVDPDNASVLRNYKLVATGEEIADSFLDGNEFVGTVQIPESPLGTLVFHLFVEKPII